MQIWAQKLIPQHLVSRFMGKLARCQVEWFKNFLIRLFIKHFKVDMSEAVQENYQQYASFNDFFTRPLKTGIRPQPNNPEAIVCPVDGFVSEFGLIEEQQLFQAKGHTYNLKTLLGGDEYLVSLFRNGAFFTAYLSPSDYHRVHMPVSGTLKKMIHVPGALFSVNPYTVTRVPNLFARNERVICYFETEYGPMAMIMVGAIVVASIVMHWHGSVTPPSTKRVRQWSYVNNPIQLSRGDEMGYFEVGSTIIMLFGENAIEWNSAMQPAQVVRLGQSVGISSS